MTQQMTISVANKPFSFRLGKLLVTPPAMRLLIESDDTLGDLFAQHLEHINDMEGSGAELDVVITNLKLTTGKRVHCITTRHSATMMDVGSK